MNLKLGETMVVEFPTSQFSTGAAMDAASLPVGTISKGGVDDALTVTVTKLATGRYKAAFTPTTGDGFAAGDKLNLSIAATVDSVAAVGVIWTGKITDSDVDDLALSAEMDAAHALLTTPAQVAAALTTYDAPTKAELDAAVAPLGTTAGQAVIAAKTNNLPGAPAAVGSEMILTAAYDAAKAAAQVGDAMTLVADAVNAAAVAAGAVTKIQVGLATSPVLTLVLDFLQNRLEFDLDNSKVYLRNDANVRAYVATLTDSAGAAVSTSTPGPINRSRWTAV